MSTNYYYRMCCDTREKCGCVGYNNTPRNENPENVLFNPHGEEYFNAVYSLCEEHNCMDIEKCDEHERIQLLIFECDCYIVVKYQYNEQDSGFTCEEVKRFVCDGHTNNTLETPSPFKLD